MKKRKIIITLIALFITTFTITLYMKNDKKSEGMKEETASLKDKKEQELLPKKSLKTNESSIEDEFVSNSNDHIESPEYDENLVITAEGLEVIERVPRNEDLSMLIAKYHETLNEITTFDAYKNIDWSNMRSINKEMIDDINKILSKEGTYPSSIELDLERISDLAKISNENQDSTAIIYIHRILHDLDVEYNSLEHSKYGFSSYDNGGENQATVADYIKEHRNMKSN